MSLHSFFFLLFHCLGFFFIADSLPTLPQSPPPHFVLSISQENQRPASDYNSPVSQLFAFCLHSINGVNPHSRCARFLLVSLRMGLGSPGSRGAQCMTVVYLEEQQEEITKLSQIGPACCPAAVSSCMVATSKGQMSTARPRAIAGTGGLSPVQGTR